MENLKKRIRYIELDIFRIILAYCIVLFHYTFRGYAADNMSVIGFTRLGEIFKYGYIAIYGFFLLSGYVVIYSAQTKNFTEFVYSRIRRLYPSYWIAVFLTSIFIYVWGAPRYHVYLSQIVVNLTMLNGYISIPSVDGAYWFLHEILKFYFYISILILFRLVNKIDKFIIIWLVCVLIALCISLPGKLLFFLMPRYAPFLISGMIFFLVKQNGWQKRYIVMQFFSFVLGCYSLIKSRPHMIEHYKTNFSISVIIFIILLFYFVLYLSVSEKLKISSNNKIIILFSAASYPLYLIHQNIGFIMFNHFYDIFNKYMLLFSVIFFVTCISILISKYIEPLILKQLDAIYKIINSPTKHST